MKIAKLKKIYNQVSHDLTSWAQNKIIGLFAFNILVMLMIVLRSAGYFDPFFPITVNFIVLFSLVLSIVLLNVGSKIMFIIAVIFWIMASILKLANIDVWAERTAVYTFQALLIGGFLLITESFFGSEEKITGKE